MREFVDGGVFFALLKHLQFKKRNIVYHRRPQSTHKNCLTLKPQLLERLIKLGVKVVEKCDIQEDRANLHSIQDAVDWYSCCV